MKLYILSLGDCCVVNEVVAPGIHDGKRIHIPVSGYLIENSEGEAVLVDTGMNRVHVTDPEHTWRGQSVSDKLMPVMRAEDYLLRRLADIDVGPADVRHVINTHLHFDHAGNNELFPAATFYVQRDHYEMAKDNPSFPNQYWNLAGLSYELLDGETELFPGIEIIRSPGHAPGHQSIMVRLPHTGGMLLCGDAIYCQDNLDHDSWGSQANPVVARESGLRLRDLAAKEEAVLVFGHDPGQALSLERSPHYYD